MTDSFPFEDCPEFTKVWNEMNYDEPWANTAKIYPGEDIIEGDPLEESERSQKETRPVLASVHYPLFGDFML